LNSLVFLSFFTAAEAEEKEEKEKGPAVRDWDNTRLFLLLSLYFRPMNHGSKERERENWECWKRERV